MSIRIGSNISSLNAQRRLAEASEQLGVSFERLSSGMRINRASDDAAGLAVQTSLNADRRVYTQGVRNVNDGLSLLNIADSTLGGLSEIVVRLRELATQASNGTLSNSQRKSLDSEAQAMAAEYFRYSRSAKFNGLSLFDGSLQGFRVQGGYGVDGSIFSSLGGAIWNGAFSDPNSTSSSATSQNVVTGDLNGDGNQDMVSVTSTGMMIQLGNGDGSFKAGVSYDNSTSTGYAVALGDFNNDGILDAATGGILSSGDSGYTIRLGVGDGTFGALSTFDTDGTAVRSIAVGDMNNDGFHDIAVGLQNAGFQKAGFRFSNGDGTFGAEQMIGATIGSASGVYDIQLVDTNNDGWLDLAGVGTLPGNLKVILGTGGGGYNTSSSISSGYGANLVRFKDLNGDGKLDAISGSGTNALIHIGNGDGSFQASLTYAGGGTINNIQIADYNGDGTQDIITALSSGNISILSGNGNGSFAAASNFTMQLASVTGLALSDTNNDGVLDIITSNTTQGTAVRLAQTKDGVNSIYDFSLRTLSDARQALSQFSSLGDRISYHRGVIGAFQSRVSVASSVLRVSSDQFAAAESRISDIDVAAETAQYVATQIKQKVASQVLGLANQDPLLVLTLLRD